MNTQTEIVVTNMLQFQTTCNEIVTHLIECRKSASLSQQGLAEWIGTHRVRVARFETAKPVTDFELLFFIAEKFGVQIQLNYTES